jgi:uncharacterized protein YndB with AHSA1/START domain
MSTEPNSTETARPGESAEATANTLTMTRIFKAPRELVFAAWIDPDQLAQWWGPDHLHTPRETVVVEPRVGGAWAATMVMDDNGMEFPSTGTFARFDPPNGFELRHEPNQFFAFSASVAVTFEDVDGGTRMTMVQHFDTESFDFGDSILGWGTQLEKLRRLLAV